MSKFLQEFQTFIKRGNVLELAVAVIIGGAFGKIVTSFVTDIFTPLLGLLLGGVNFSALSFKVGEAVITYGNFIQSVIDFLIIAFAVFMVVRTVNTLQKRQDNKEAVLPPLPPPEVILLTEIRDLLRTKA